MFKTKFWVLFTCVLTITISSTFSLGQFSQAIATVPTSNHAASTTEPPQIAQFGLPSITRPNIPKVPPVPNIPKTPTNTPNVPREINNRVDQIESEINNIKNRLPNVLFPLIPEKLFSLEDVRISQFSNYFGEDLPAFERQPSDINQVLTSIAQSTGHRYALIYISFQKDNTLEFMLLAPGAEAQTLYTVNVEQKSLERLVAKFRSDLFTSANFRNNSDKIYLTISQQLYTTLITPIESYLKTNRIDGLIFSLDQGLRSLPFAALHDGDRYLIQKYSLAIIPSFASIQNQYTSLKKQPVLAMGAETFETLNPLPGAELEVQAIADFTKGTGLLNEAFTIDNLTKQRHENKFPIVHLATHAEFNPGKPENSSIYLWHDELGLNEMDKLQLDNPQLNLLVLSACQTALGSKEAELGFSGLTIASGAKTALGSLWSVSDEGTVILMQNFYNYLQTETTKSDALRKAQISLLSGDLSIVNGQVRSRSGAPVTIELSEDLKNLNFNQLTHPFYWSAFTLVGEPW